MVKTTKALIEAILSPGHSLFSFPEKYDRHRRRSRRGLTHGEGPRLYSLILVREGSASYLCKALNAFQSLDDEDGDESVVLKWSVKATLSSFESKSDTADVVKKLLEDQTMFPTHTFAHSNSTVTGKGFDCERWASLNPISSMQDTQLMVSTCGDTGVNFVAVFTERPGIASSVVFRARCALRNESLPLQLACLKRKMIGMYVMYGEGMLTTNLTIDFDSTTLDLRLESILCLQAGLSRDRANVFVIAPSTRITILEPEGATSKAEYQGNQKTTPPDVIQILLGTIRTMSEAKNVVIPRMFLLSGPPGVGKTHAVDAALQLTPTPIFAKFLRGSNIMASSSSNPLTPGFVLKRHFEELKTRSLDIMCLIFLDECDALMSSPTATTMLALQLDEMALEGTQVIVVAATNNVDSIPSNLKRPGRFEQALILHPPSSSQRLTILEDLVGRKTADLALVAETTIGFVPADLQALVRHAKLLGLSDSQSLGVRLRKAMLNVRASVGYVADFLYERC